MMQLVRPSIADRMIVRVADMVVSDDPAKEIITFSLGSCLGITIHDATARVTGMLHLLLPDSAIDPGKARRNPAMFADTGIPLLFRRASELGAARSRLVIKVAGGADMRSAQDFFRIGARNWEAVEGLFRKQNLRIAAYSVGGAISRTMRISPLTGVVTIQTPGVPDLKL